MLFDRLIHVPDPDPHDAATNMALDEVLLSGACHPLIRIYRWARPAVSFGYFGKYQVISAAWPDRELVRRMTGGGVVEHGADITYTLVVPASHEVAQLAARESYRAIHAALATWLAARAIPASLARQPADGGNGICFQSPVEADLIAGGRKLAGAAQRRTREGLLCQCSILGVPDGWRDELPSAFSARIEPRDFTATELAAARAIAARKYATREWTQRV